jgi:hypothetical protein
MRLLTFALLVLTAVVLDSSEATAEQPPDCNIICHGGDASSGPGGISVDAGADGGPSGGGPGLSVIRGPAHDPCTYRSLSAHDLLAWHISYAFQGNGDPPEPPADVFYGDDPDLQWALAHCPANAGREVLVWWPVGGRPPASLIDALRQRARDAVPFPVLAQHGAPSGERDVPLITQLPTWLWVDPAQWGPVEAEASIPGIVTVTATGTPAGLTWDPGTGDPPVSCDGPGVAYDFGRSESAQSTTCAYTYRHSSDVAPGAGPYRLTMGVRWSVAWQCSPGCGGGPMAGVTVTTERAVWVAELQALSGATP